MKIESETTPVRNLMPPRFTRLILSEMGEGTTANVSDAVALEKVNSKYWPFIEKLALKTDPKAYRARLKYLQEKQSAASKMAA